MFSDENGQNTNLSTRKIRVRFRQCIAAEFNTRASVKVTGARER